MWEWHKVEAEQVKWSLGEWTQPTGCFSRDTSGFSLPFLPPLSPSPPLCGHCPALRVPWMQDCRWAILTCKPSGNRGFYGCCKRHGCSLELHKVCEWCQMLKWSSSTHCCPGYRQMLIKPWKTIPWMCVLRPVQGEFWNVTCERDFSSCCPFSMEDRLQHHPLKLLWPV